MAFSSRFCAFLALYLRDSLGVNIVVVQETFLCFVGEKRPNCLELNNDGAFFHR